MRATSQEKHVVGRNAERLKSWRVVAEPIRATSLASRCRWISWVEPWGGSSSECAWVVVARGSVGDERGVERRWSGGVPVSIVSQSKSSIPGQT